MLMPIALNCLRSYVFVELFAYRRPEIVYVIVDIVDIKSIRRNQANTEIPYDAEIAIN